MPNRSSSPARKRLTRSESQALTRERLLKSATRVFMRRGYAGASIDLIAEEAGYSKGAVYSNFDSKESIFLELLRAKMIADIENIEALVEASSDLDTLLAGLSSYLDASEQSLDFTAVIVEFLTAGERSREGSRVCALLYQQEREAIAKLLRIVFARLSIPPPIPFEDMAANLVALTLGLATQRAIDRDAVSVTRWSGLIDDYLHMLMRDQTGTWKV